jgi:hypothetical protein
MIHQAMAIAEGDLTNALIGEMMLTRIIKSGLTGLVIDGAVRDAAFIRCQKFRVYAAGVTHRGPYKSGPGEINVPIAIDGMVIAENCEVSSTAQYRRDARFALSCATISSKKAAAENNELSLPRKPIS